MSSSSNVISPISNSSQTDAAEFVAGFKRVEAEIRAISDRELQIINIDVPGAVATVLGALPEIRALRSELTALPGFDLPRFDKLRDYALALGHTHAMYRAASGPSDGVTELAERVSNLRDILQADATALAKRGILDEGQVLKLRSGSGYKNIAFEVVGLIGLFREHWDKIHGRSALQLDELERAGELAQKLVTGVGLREQAPAALGAASALRQRAFTVLLRAYDEARRGISYLRWQTNDAADIAPSLFAGRGGRKAAEDVANSDEPTTTPLDTHVGAPAPAAAANQATGLPGSSPFVRP